MTILSLSMFKALIAFFFCLGILLLLQIPVNAAEVVITVDGAQIPQPTTVDSSIPADSADSDVTATQAEMSSKACIYLPGIGVRCF